ncbi:MAG: HAD family hydrolase [Gammaproteobacteria bacterium]|nr:HAD family hydrolase [Gammaproteobacteria bacterium]
MPELKALLFDVDGTLADTERNGHRLAFNAAFNDAGLDWEWSEALYGKLLTVAGGKERIRFYLDQFNPGFKRPRDLDAFIAKLHRTKTDHYTALISSGAIPLRSGVRRLLEESTADGLRLAIATTTTFDNVTALLESTLGEGAVSRFEVIAAGDVVDAKKPAPDIYIWTMARLGLDADSCLAIEDSKNGLHSAHAAGIRSVLVTVNGYTEHEDFSGAGLVVSHLGDTDDPSRIIQGSMPQASWVNMEVLCALHDRCTNLLAV